MIQLLKLQKTNKILILLIHIYKKLKLNLVVKKQLQVLTKQIKNLHLNYMKPMTTTIYQVLNVFKKFQQAVQLRNKMVKIMRLMN